MEDSMPDNQTIIRNAYNLAEVKDIPGWIEAFTADGTFTDMSTAVTYRGETLGDLVEIYGTAFSDMHRELYRFYRATTSLQSNSRSRARTTGLSSCRREQSHPRADGWTLLAATYSK
jgi:hypothetical protein